MYGQNVSYGLDGYDSAEHQATLGILAEPFVTNHCMTDESRPMAHP